MNQLKNFKNYRVRSGGFILYMFLTLVIAGADFTSLYGQQNTVDPETRIRELGIKLRVPGASTGNFVGAVRVGNIVYLAGQGPLKDDGTYMKGQVGKDLNLQQAQEAARLTGISLLSALKNEVGNLNNVKRIVKVLGMVYSTSDFNRHTEVINGFSDLMVEIFGEAGKHARSAVGVGTLNMNIPVEIEMIVEMKDGK